MVAKAKRVLRLVVGVVLLLLGIAGLFLPFLQGILLIAAGLALLSKESERVRRAVEFARERWKQRSWFWKGESLHGR